MCSGNISRTKTIKITDYIEDNCLFLLIIELFSLSETQKGILENIYFLCLRVEIKSIINKNRQFFFLFYAKIVILRFKKRRATKNGT